MSSPKVTSVAVVKVEDVQVATVTCENVEALDITDLPHNLVARSRVVLAVDKHDGWREIKHNAGTLEFYGQADISASL